MPKPPMTLVLGLVVMVAGLSTVRGAELIHVFGGVNIGAGLILAITGVRNLRRDNKSGG